MIELKYAVWTALNVWWAWSCVRAIKTTSRR